ncbi:MAG: hypothetical protein E2O95_01505 [Acidobacteria bacterium]|nr:MAG: hypothetical protein E2O95_01505 [Acidobacteriota bacterium]
MSTPADIVSKLADVQKRLFDLPDDAFEEKYKLLNEQDQLREVASGYAGMVDSERSDEELLRELASKRQQMKSIEGKRIDLVVQAGSGGASTGEMGNLGGVQINKGIEDAHGLPAIKARIGVIKGTLRDRGVEFPDAT